MLAFVACTPAPARAARTKTRSRSLDAGVHPEQPVARHRDVGTRLCPAHRNVLLDAPPPQVPHKLHLPRPFHPHLLGHGGRHHVALRRAGDRDRRRNDGRDGRRCVLRRGVHAAGPDQVRGLPRRGAVWHHRVLHHRHLLAQPHLVRFGPWRVCCGKCWSTLSWQPANCRHGGHPARDNSYAATRPQMR